METDTPLVHPGRPHRLLPRAHWSGEGGRDCSLVRPFFVLLADRTRVASGVDGRWPGCSRVTLEGWFTAVWREGGFLRPCWPQGTLGQEEKGVPSST